jgi:hypothetical protein
MQQYTSTNMNNIKNAYKNPYTKKVSRVHYPALSDNMNKRYERSEKRKFITKCRTIDRKLKKSRFEHETQHEWNQNDEWDMLVQDTKIFEEFYRL